MRINITGSVKLPEEGRFRVFSPNMTPSMTSILRPSSTGLEPSTSWGKRSARMLLTTTMLPTKKSMMVSLTSTKLRSLTMLLKTMTMTTAAAAAATTTMITAP